MVTSITILILIIPCFIPLQIIEANEFQPAISYSLLPVMQENSDSEISQSNPLPLNISTTSTVSKSNDNQLVYYAFNIGQADCHLIELNDHYLMIDTGLSNASPDSKNINYLNISEVKHFLKKKKIKKLDFLIITHYDGDHIGGMLQLLGYKTKTKSDDIKVKKIISRKHTKESLEIMRDYFNPEEMKNTQYRNYLKLINVCYQNMDKEVPFTLNFKNKKQVHHVDRVVKEVKKLNSIWLSPKQGQTLFFANRKVKLQFLNPTKSFISNHTLKHHPYAASVNNDSLVVKLLYQDKSILFTGDIDKEACIAIINYTNKRKNLSLNSTILKIPHHGVNANFYNEKLNLNFIKYVSPSHSIITCAKYFKPSLQQCCLSKETIQYMGTIYRTDMIGSKGIAICTIIDKNGSITMKRLLKNNKLYQYKYVQAWEYPISDIVAPKKFDIAIGTEKKLPATAISKINKNYYAPTVNLLSYQTEDPSIATVNQHGYVTGIKTGTTTIVITALDGTSSRWFCKITVSNPVDALTWNREPASVMTADDPIKEITLKRKKKSKEDNG